MEKKNSVLLDVDRSILEKNLLLEENRNEEFDQFLPYLQGYEKEMPWKVVQPNQGICIKTRTADGDKVFINLCQTSYIPCPKLLDDDDLIKLWSSDEASSYRIPMSISEGHQELDKSGNPSMVYDIAIHPDYLKKVESNKLHLKFIITVMMEAIQDKFKLQLQPEDYTILKNRKSMGKLQPHRIRQQPADQQSKKPLIEEISSTTSNMKHPQPQRKPTKNINQNTTTQSPQVPQAPSFSGTRQPEYRIVREPAEGDIQRMIAELKLDDVLVARDVTLDVGEDRLIVESRRHGYLLDVFVPYSIDQGNTRARFDRDTRVLSVIMPVVTAN